MVDGIVVITVSCVGGCHLIEQRKPVDQLVCERTDELVDRDNNATPNLHD
jgi:hypothetical protein